MSFHHRRMLATLLSLVSCETIIAASIGIESKNVSRGSPLLRGGGNDAEEPFVAQSRRQLQPVTLRQLYTYSFGGIESLPSVKSAVNLLENQGFAGLAVQGTVPPGVLDSNRVIKYLNFAEDTNRNFTVAALFLSHKYETMRFNMDAEKSLIDVLANRHGYGTLWWWFMDNVNDGTVTDAKVQQLLRRIFNYAKQRNVRVLLYPHDNTWYESIDQTLPIVQDFNHPLLGTSIHLSHERLHGKSDAELQTVFQTAVPTGKIFAVILSGNNQVLDPALGDSNQVNIPLPDSEYDVTPFLTYMRDSNYDGPVFFINFKLTNPRSYLRRTKQEWDRLCTELGIFEPSPRYLFFMPCFHQLFLQCIRSHGLDTAGACPVLPDDFTGTLGNCLANRPVAANECLDQAAFNTRTTCYDRPGPLNGPLCRHVFDGYNAKQVSQQACTLVKQRCVNPQAKACTAKKNNMMMVMKRNMRRR